MAEQRLYRLEEVIPTREPAPKLHSGGLNACRQVGSKVFVIGSLGRADITVAIFDFQENSWNVVDVQGEERPPLYCHANFIFEDRLFLHAGRAKDDKAVADLFFLDLVTLEWRKCITSVERPKARFWHIGEYLERLRMFVIFGGFDGEEYSLGDLWALWRCFVSLTCWEGELLLFGGQNHMKADTADLFVLQPPGYDPVKAHRVEGATSIAYKCFGHTVIATSTELYVFDGARKSFNPLKLTML